LLPRQHARSPATWRWPQGVVLLDCSGVVDEQQREEEARRQAQRIRKMKRNLEFTITEFKDMLPLARETPPSDVFDEPWSNAIASNAEIPRNR
jgi:hypothetical protein